MIINSPEDLVHSENRAVIINYNTKLVSTLSLLAALKYTEMPVLLIDCESTDGSYLHFQALLERHNFDLMTAPLRNHGLTLDWLFPQINADFVLLVDSDLEILDNQIIEFFKRYTASSYVFGAGFTNGPGILDAKEFEGTPIFNGLYFERPWMPLVYLKTSLILEALNNGLSFTEITCKRTSIFTRLWSRKTKLYSLKYHRQLLDQYNLIFYDTGAMIYDYLRYRKHYFFASIPEPLHHLHTKHFFGTTRKVVSENDSNNGGGNMEIQEEVRLRLFEKYNYAEG